MRACAALLVTIAFAVACGGGGGGTEVGNPALSEEVYVGITDAEGDFVTYAVDVLSLTLRKANGTTVEALPVNTRIDFAQYTDLTEFVTAVSVPTGTYVSATVEVGYTDADIRVEDAAGDAVQVTNLVDLDGEPVETLELTVNFDIGKRLIVAGGSPAHLVLDFDLEASNAVTFDGGGTPTVTIDSFISASVNAGDSKIHRVRGPLKSVRASGGSFNIVIRPFIHLLSGGNEDFGTLDVVTTADTVFQIDGETYQGGTGLAQLAASTPNTAVVALGDLKHGPLRFEAREVNAGSSVPGGTLDMVTGSVTSRTGDEVTVKGATLVRSNGSVIFNDTVTVQLADTTVVRRQLSLTAYTIDDLSVGQRVTVFGQITSDDVSDLRLDGSSGYAHMLYTTLFGTVSGAPVLGNGTNTVTAQLTSIDLRGTDLFDFTGTGSAAGNDADPAAYEMDTGALDVSGLAAGTPIRALGFVSPFGEAPPDFEAHTVQDLSDAFVMRVTWNPASDTAVSGTAADSVALDLTGTGILHHVFSTIGVTDLTELGDDPVIAAHGSGLGLFLIGRGSVLQVYLSFENFAQGLQDQLDGGATVKAVVARGFFDEGTATVTATLVGVALQ